MVEAVEYGANYRGQGCKQNLQKINLEQ